MRVAQADHTLERGAHTRLLSHLTCHCIAKVLARVGEPPGQLPLALHLRHRRHLLHHHEHVACRVDHDAAHANLGEAVHRERRRRAGKPAREQRIPRLGMVELEAKLDRRTDARGSGSRNCEPQALLARLLPPSHARPQLTGEAGDAVWARCGGGDRRQLDAAVPVLFERYTVAVVAHFGLGRASAVR